MPRLRSVWTQWCAAVGVTLLLSGCAVRFSQRSPWDVQQIQALSEQLDQFRNLAQLKAEEADQLRAARELLEKRLSSEIASKDVDVGFDERGLVVRVVDRVLFDSGKAKLRREALPVLDKVARVLNEDLPDQPVGIEGYTDNQPIKFSGWKDNGELSLARARSVLGYLVEKRSVDSVRIAPNGHGEGDPIAPNDTVAGRQRNRRVEIVVLPQGRSAAQGSRSVGDVDDVTAYSK